MTKALELGELANYASVNVAGNTVTFDTSLTNDSTTVGGNTALTLRTYSDDRAANAFANAIANAASYTDAKVANLVNTSPASLDTLGELAAALSNDASFSTTVTTSIGNAYTNAYNQAVTLSNNAYTNAVTNAASLYLPLAGGTISGSANIGGVFITRGQTDLGQNGSNNQTFRALVGTGAFPWIQSSHASGSARLRSVANSGNVDFWLSATGSSGSIRFYTNAHTDEQFRITSIANTSNYIQVAGAAAAAAPAISVQGSDTNIDLTLTPKGSGIVRASGGMFVNGDVTVANIVGIGANSLSNSTLTLGRVDTGDLGAKINFCRSLDNGVNYYIDVYQNYFRIVDSDQGSVRFMIDVSGNVIPGANATQSLGTPNMSWLNIYTNDFHLSNEGSENGNSIDGTKGNWTIQEGADHLFIINNKNGKKYKFNLEEIV